MNSAKDKMYNYEATPPSTGWEKIAAALDEAQLQNEFPSRLYNMEIDPPATAWEKINSSLNPANEAITTSPLRRIPSFFRYAAAAIFIGVVALGIIKFTANNDTNKTGAAQIMVSKDSSVPSKNVIAAPETLTAKSDSNEENEAIEKSKTMLAKLDRPVKRIGRVRHSIISSNVDNSDEADLSESIYAYADHVPNLADRYIMLMTPDGNIIRMSKKWSDLLCCVSGEEQDTDCKDQLKKWQKKIATSSLAPSPGNFMDILGLVNSLNESTEL